MYFSDSLLLLQLDQHEHYVHVYVHVYAYRLYMYVYNFIQYNSVNIQNYTLFRLCIGCLVYMYTIYNVHVLSLDDSSIVHVRVHASLLCCCCDG